MEPIRAAGSYGAHETFAAILIGDGPTVRVAESAVALIGGRVATRIGWREAAAGIATALPMPVVVAEAAGDDETALADGLAALERFATPDEIPVVIAFEADRIDQVAGQLFGRHVEALCEPTMAERIAALAVAAERIRAPILHDPWRESETTRLQRLNQEVARIAEILARLTREEPGGDPGDVADRRRGYDAGPGGTGGADDPGEIRRMIRLRRLRDQYFEAGLFEDPAWDMLLDLYAAELEGSRVSVSSLCIAAAVAPTTALRWITKLTEARLFVRQPDPHDRRRAFIALSPHTREAMRNYFAAARRGE